MLLAKRFIFFNSSVPSNRACLEYLNIRIIRINFQKLIIRIDHMAIAILKIVKIGAFS